MQYCIVTSLYKIWVPWFLAVSIVICCHGILIANQWHVTDKILKLEVCDIDIYMLYLTNMSLLSYLASAIIILPQGKGWTLWMGGNKLAKFQNNWPWDQISAQSTNCVLITISMSGAQTIIWLSMTIRSIKIFKIHSPPLPKAGHYCTSLNKEKYNIF